MSKVVPLGKLMWDASASTDVTGYYVYAGDESGVNYSNTKVDVGNVLEVQLPIPGQALVDGNVFYGIGAYDDVGNISDLTVMSLAIDTTPPNSVTNLHYIQP